MTSGLQLFQHFNAALQYTDFGGNLFVVIIRYEEEGRTAKAIESERLLKAAEEARRAAAARKEAEAARLR